MNELQFDRIMRRFDRLEEKLLESRPVMTIDQAADYADTTTARLLALIAEGRLTASRPQVTGQDTIYIKRQDLDAMLLSGNAEKARHEAKLRILNR